MKRQNATLIAVLVVGAVAIAIPCLWAQQTLMQSTQLMVLSSPDSDANERLQQLAAVLDFTKWEQEEGRLVAPAVTRSDLPEPQMATSDFRTCTAIRIGELPWGHCEWAWSSGRKNERAPAGRLELAMTLTPSARAAHEHLLLDLVQNMLPSELLVDLYRQAEQPEHLGTAAVLTRSPDDTVVNVRFVRANLSVAVRGSGELSEHALPLARRLDAKIASQEPLTYEQLLERRPVVSVSARAPRPDAAAYSVTVPGNRPVVGIRAFVQGQQAPADRRIVVIGPRKEPVDVEVLVITQELLAGSGRHTVAPSGQ